MTHTDVWAAVLAELRGDPNFDLWIRPIKAVGIKDGHLICEVDTRLFSWARRRYAPRIGDVVRAVSSLDGIELRPA